jgi:regulator of sigma E protease
MELVYLIGIIALFFLLIAPHEFGHYFVAKRVGVGVKEFAIGFGPTMLKHEGKGTVYSIRALPIGGYVRLEGLEGNFDAPDSFYRRSLWEKLAVLVAGPLMNYVVAAVSIFVILVMVSSTVPGVIFAVLQNTPAAKAGLKPGDRIVSIDSHKVVSFSKLSSMIQASNGKPIEIKYQETDGAYKIIVVRPELIQGAYRIGIEEKIPFNLLYDVKQAVVMPIATGAAIVGGLDALVTGRVPGGIVGPSGLTGPIGIVAIAAQTVAAGLLPYLQLLSFLSVSLAIVNILPIPALDGGRILVALLEGLHGKPFDRKIEMEIQWYGLIILLAFVAIISVFDIQRLLNGEFMGLGGR